MKLGWLIFILAFFVRFFNLLLLDINIDNYLLKIKILIGTGL